MKEFKLSKERLVSVGDKFLDLNYSTKGKYAYWPIEDRVKSIKLNAITGVQLVKRFSDHNRNYAPNDLSCLLIYFSGDLHEIEGTSDELSPIYDYLKSIL